MNMACLLQPECNLLHGFSRCKLPVEVVDVEVKITSMQGMHVFRRDRTTQLIKCTPWSTRLCPHPTIIKKMKTFLEVEGKMGLIPAPISQFRPPLPNTNPNIRKNNAAEKRKRATPKKFRPATPNLLQHVCPYQRSLPKPKNDAPIPSIPVHESIPWPGAGKISGNLFEDRNWLLPPNYLDNGKENKTESELKATTNVTSPKPQIKEEEEFKTGEQPTEKCSWEPGCPFCKSREQKEEQGKMQPQKLSPKAKQQATRPKTLSLNMTKAKQQWEEEMERLNSNYNLDCYSDSELDSESDGEQYRYEHGYETLVKNARMNLSC